MKIKLVLAICIAIELIIIVQSCERDENETKISKHEASNSHNMGQNCMNCHKQNGSGESWFKIAGTVYDSLKINTFANATVKLYTGPNATGTLKYTIQVDARGNFFSTENIDFGNGLYTCVEGNEMINHMGSTVTSGNCNTCHNGTSTEKIWTK